MLTQYELKQIIKYDRDTGEFNWRSSRSGVCPTLKACKTPNSSGYFRIYIDGRMYYAHQLAWLYVYGEFPKNRIRHKNGIKSFNAISNLKEIAKTNRSSNILRSNNTSGITGVCFYKRVGKWQVQMMHEGDSVFSGYFDDFVEAVCVRCSIEQCIDENRYIDSSARKYVMEYVIEGGEQHE